MIIISIITYSSASWTLTKSEKKRLDAYITKALRRIVGVRWYDYVTNASMFTPQNPQRAPMCLQAHMSSTTRHASRRYPGIRPQSSCRRTRGRARTTPLGWPSHQRHPAVPEWCRASNRWCIIMAISHSWGYVSCDTINISKQASICAHSFRSAHTRRVHRLRHPSGSGPSIDGPSQTTLRRILAPDVDVPSRHWGESAHSTQCAAISPSWTRGR